MAEEAPRSSPLLVLQPSKGWVSLDLAGVWEHRELLFFLTWRDIKLRYKQTVLGVLWAIIQPMAPMLIFTLVFGRLVRRARRRSRIRCSPLRGCCRGRSSRTP